LGSLPLKLSAKDGFRDISRLRRKEATGWPSILIVGSGRCVCV
jgi:hypothetical protein